MFKKYLKVFYFLSLIVLGTGLKSYAQPACPTTNVTPANGTVFCATQTIQLSWTAVATATGYDVYLDNGAATTLVSSNQPATTYSAAGLTAGTYYWRVVSRNASGAASGCATRNFIVNAPTGEAEITIVANPGNTVCPGTNVTFIATPINAGSTPTYDWRVNGVSVGTGLIYTSAALVDEDVVTCILTSSQTCMVKNRDTSNAIVMDILPVPSTNITANSPLSFCIGGNVQLTAVTNGSNVTWQRNTIDVGTGLMYSATQSGSYTFKATLNGCTATSAPVIVNAVALPDTAMTITGSTSFCGGGSVTLSVRNVANTTYEWRLNSAVVGTGNSIVATEPGLYQVLITAQNACALLSRIVPVSVLPSPVATVSASGSTTICEGQSVVLSANYNADYAYQWTENNINIPGATGITYTATDAGNYRVRITNVSNGCQATSAAIPVTVNALPTVQITDPLIDTSICEGNVAILTASNVNNATYQWYRNGIYIGTGIETYQAATSGDYTVRITNTNTGCQSEASNIIHVNVVPVPDAYISVLNGGDTAVCAGGTVTLKAPSGVGYTYQWSNNGNDIVGATDENFYANYSGWFNVYITNNGCSALSATQIITVLDPLYVPIYQSGNNFTTESTFESYQWYRDGRIINGATLSSYYATYNGNYTVKVTDINGCTATSLARPYNDGIPYTNVSEIDVDAITVYPNPATAMLTVNSPVTVNVIVKSIDGKDVLVQQAAKTIDVSMLNNGIYLLYVLNTRNELIKIQKVVKQ